MYVHQLPVVKKMDIVSKLVKKFNAEGMSKDQVQQAIANALDSKYDDIRYLLTTPAIDRLRTLFVTIDLQLEEIRDTADRVRELNDQLGEDIRTLTDHVENTIREAIRRQMEEDKCL